MKKYLTPLIFGVIVLGLIIFAIFALKSPEKNSNNDSSTAKQLTGDDLATLQAGYSQGPADAKVVLVEFGDYQCPACGAWHPELKNKILPKYADKVRIVFKNFPLDSLHKNANIASLAAEAAGAQGKYWEMHNILYEKQDEWVNASDPVAKFGEYAGTLGLDAGKLVDDVKSKKYQDKIETDRKFGEKIKITGTPSFYVNGSYVDTQKSGPDDLTSAIDAAIQS